MPARPRLTLCIACITLLLVFDSVFYSPRYLTLRSAGVTTTRHYTSFLQVTEAVRERRHLIAVQFQVTEAVRVRRRLDFNGRFVNCNNTNRMNLSVSIAESCSLKLRVSSLTNTSLDFNTLDKKLNDTWNQAPVDTNSSFYSNASVKYILLWTERKPHMFGEGRSAFLKAFCPVSNCHITTDRRQVATGEVAAVLLHLWWISRGRVSLPKREDYPNARMILWAGEAPDRLPMWMGDWSGLVDSVVSYRRDADVIRTRGSVLPIQNAIGWKQRGDVAANKTKMAAWFVSNCAAAPSLRNLLTQKLQRYGVAVDIFGKCGQFSCPKEDADLCYQMLESQYKFYLSFENSLCNHYVTEKFYNILRYDVVPVTYGLGHELTGAPKDAYIDVFDFPSVKALAHYLLYLDSNDDAYNQYFRWKQYFKVSTNFGLYDALCEVCATLTLGPAPPVPEKFHDLETWYSEGQCIQVQANDRLRIFLGLS